MQLPQIAGLHHLAVDHVAVHRPAILHAASHYRNVGTAKSERRINVVLRRAFRAKPSCLAWDEYGERVLAPSGLFPSPLTNSGGQKFENDRKAGSCPSATALPASIAESAGMADELVG
jgi:hypothetical protein